MDIKVVKIVDKKLYRTILKKKDYKMNKNKQIILPKGFYSKGFLERVWSIDYNSLPILPK